ncbi:hypothetical protein [Vagococcus zengguangii]|uniref:hypothetical protein n=1 Tax=Vagococcus zengguangii TaxID=2571750 RepID=UPI00110917B7|nr:hypothetical protein [Vagococcus zengguangii]
MLSTILALLLIIATSIGSTFSAMKDSDSVDNQFRIGNLQTEIIEEFPPVETITPETPYKKEVTVKNTGDVPIFIRVLAHPYLTYKEQLIPTVTDDGSKLLEVDYNLSDWIDGQDGYFYYKKVIEPEEITPFLFSKVIFHSFEQIETLAGVNFADLKLDFTIKVEAINTSKFAYRDAWWQGEIKLPEVDALLQPFVTE